MFRRAAKRAVISGFWSPIELPAVPESPKNQRDRSREIGPEGRQYVYRQSPAFAL